MQVGQCQVQGANRRTTAARARALTGKPLDPSAPPTKRGAVDCHTFPLLFLVPSSGPNHASRFPIFRPWGACPGSAGATRPAQRPTGDRPFAARCRAAAPPPQGEGRRRSEGDQVGYRRILLGELVQPIFPRWSCLGLGYQTDGGF